MATYSMAARRRGSALALVLGLVVALGLSGCSGLADSSDAAEDQLTMAVPAVPDSLMPLLEPVAAQFAHLPMLSSLFEYQEQELGEEVLAGPQDVVAGLASNHKTTPQGLVVTLREAASAEGNELTADDVVYTWERAVAVKDSIAMFLLQTGGIDVEKPVAKIDERTVRFNGDLTPLVEFALTYYYPGVLDSVEVKKHATDDDPWASEWLRENSASFGPYYVESFEPGQKVLYAANPNYWGDAPAYQKLTVLATESQSPVQLMRSGSADFASRVDGYAYQQLAEDSKFETNVAPSLGQQVVVLNKQSVPALANADVRRALSLAVNREEIATTIFSGTATPAESILSRSVPGVADAEGEYFDYDLKRAKEILATTPYADGFTVDLTIGAEAAPGVDANSLAIAVQDAWGELGVEVKIENAGSATRFSQIQSSHSFHALLTSEAPAAADIAYAMSLLHVEGGPFNYGFDSDAEVSELVAKANEMPLGDERTVIARDALTVWNDSVADIPLVDAGIAYVAAKDTCGLATFPYLAALPQRLAPC